jgi:hypothetical protein
LSLDHLPLTALTAIASIRHLLLRTLTFGTSFLATPLTARHLPHRLATFDLLRTLLSLLLSLLTTRIHLVHHLLTTGFLLLTHLLHHLPAIPALLPLRLLLPLPAAAHLLLSLLRSLLLSWTLLTLLLPTASSLLLRPLLTLRRSGLSLLRLRTLNLRLATSPVSAAVISTAVSATTALAERITAGAHHRYERQCGHG